MKPKGNPNWVKGVSGNPAGKPRNPSFREWVDKDHPELLELWRAGLEQKLKDQDSKILTWFGDQYNGKAPQPITGVDGGPVAVTFVENLPE